MTYPDPGGPKYISGFTTLLEGTQHLVLLYFRISIPSNRGGQSLSAIEPLNAELHRFFEITKKSASYFSKHSKSIH
jgi:hypothetical protein